MKKTILFALLCVLGLSSGFAQNDSEKTSAVHVSFIPPLSTHGGQAGEYTNGVSFNILAGISKNEKYFTFGGLGNIIRNDASGVQFAGLFNTIGNDAKGLQFAGLFNTVRNDAYGIQFGGLLNRAGGYTNGLQFAGIANMAGDVSGFQFAGIANMARNVKGAQFGLINIAESNDYPIGLLNIIKNGEMSVGVTYDDRGSVVTSFRSGGRIMYGILGAGYNYESDDEPFVVEGGFGAHIPIVKRFRINMEAKSQWMSSFSDTYVNKSSFSILPAFRILPHLELFAGPSINYMETDNLKNKSMFPGSNLWKKYREDKLEQVFIGYTAGLQWIF